MESIRERVHAIQDRTYENRNIAIGAVLDLVRAIGELAERDPAAPAIRPGSRRDRRAT